MKNLSFPLRFRIALAALLVGCWLSAANAHAFLDHASPKPGAVLNTPPGQIVLIYDRGIEPAFSWVRLENAESDQLIGTEKAKADPEDASKLTLSIPELPPGTYRVSWSVVARDGHRTEGDYTFTVR